MLELKNIKSIGKRIFCCSQRSTEIALLLTDWPLTTCSWARISRQHLRLAWRVALILTIKFWTLLQETFTWVYRKYGNTNNNSSICRVFVVFSRKSPGKQIHAKTIWLKNVLKPTLDMKQQVFPRNKLKIIIIIIIKTIHAVNKWVKQDKKLSNSCLTWGISPICRMDPKRDPYHVSKCQWFRQPCTYLKCDVNLPYK